MNQYEIALYGTIIAVAGIGMALISIIMNQWFKSNKKADNSENKQPVIVQVLPQAISPSLPMPSNPPACPPVVPMDIDPHCRPQPSSGSCWQAVPAMSSRIIGREREITEVEQLLCEHRLVTLVAIGGMGKTRLAIEVATRAQGEDSAARGVAFVSLADIRNADEPSVLDIFITALGLDPAKHGSAKAALLAEFRDGAALLFLDNCETASPAIGLLARALLLACPGLRILATSQAPLGLGGDERVYPLDTMAVPPAGAITPEELQSLESYTLFAGRADAVWRLTQANANDLAEILRLTDGIPLAIELVAARVTGNWLRHIACQLRDSRDEVLRDTTIEHGDARHTSMQACLDYTFSHLPAPVQAFALKLAVFTGGFFSDAAREITEDRHTSDHLLHLRKRAFLKEGILLEQPRYSCVSTVQLYLQKKLQKSILPGTINELYQRHAQFYFHLLDQEDGRIRSGPDIVAALQCITADLDNIYTGMDYAEQQDNLLLIIDYASALGYYSYYRSLHEERIRRCQKALNAAEQHGKEELIAHCQNNLVQAITCYQAALRVRTEQAFPADWAMTHNNLGNAYRDLPTGDRGANLARAITCYQAALCVRIEQEFPADWAMTQNNLGIAYCYLPTGDRDANLAQAIACFQAALRVYTEQAFPADWARTQNNLGNAYCYLPTGDRDKNLAQAIACYQAALRVRTEQALPAKWAMTQMNMGITLKKSGSLTEAITCWELAERGYLSVGLHEKACEVRAWIDEAKVDGVQVVPPSSHP